MAKPIKETPILKGQDAKNFIQKMNTVESKKVDQQEIAKMMDNFSKMQSIAKFN
jgi:hypothetical protein